MDQELDVNVRHGPDASTVVLSGRFYHGTASRFGKAMRECLGKANGEVRVDFGGVSYIDSMALGTLLVYRENLANASKKIVLTNCNGPVREAMNLAHFQKVFEIR